MLKPGHKHENTPTLIKKQVEDWIQNGPSNDLVEQTDRFGEYIARLLKKTDRKKKTKNDNEDIRNDEDCDDFSNTSDIREVEIH